MKTRTVVISLIALAMSGCAHTGGYYQSSYGYTGYGSGGYTVDRYYDYPASSYYYQPGVSMSYGTYYLPSYRSHEHHDHDQHRDRDRHDAWQRFSRRQEFQPPMPRDGRRRWDNDGWRHGNIDRDSRRSESMPRLAQPGPSPMQRLQSDSAGPRERFHGGQSEHFGGGERHGPRHEGGRGDGEHGQGLGFGRR